MCYKTDIFHKQQISKWRDTELSVVKPQTYFAICNHCHQYSMAGVQRLEWQQGKTC